MEKNNLINFFLLLTFLNILLFYLGTMGIGNDIYNFLLGRGTFGDFHPDIIFDVIQTIPRAHRSGQFPAFDVVYARFFDPHKKLLVISNVVIGIIIPLIFLYNLLAKKYGKKNGLLAIFIIIFGYPFIFAFFRANPILGSAMWCIFGVFSFIHINYKTAFFSILFASLIHPASAFFGLIFLKNGIKDFLKIFFAILFAQLFSYFLIDYDLFFTLQHQFGSLNNYKMDYVYGNFGDLYNNSLYFLTKLIFPDYQKIFLIFIPLLLTIIIIVNGLKNVKQDFKSFNNLLAIYYLPIFIVLATGVAADYRLLFLNIPILFMFLNNYYKLPLFLLLIVVLPKHFVFFSSYWLGEHQDYHLVFNNLQTSSGVGITLNSIINPILLFISILLPIETFVKKMKLEQI